MLATVVAVITGVIFVIFAGYNIIKGIFYFLHGMMFEQPGEKEWKEECEKYYTWEKNF